MGDFSQSLKNTPLLRRWWSWGNGAAEHKDSLRETVRHELPKLFMRLDALGCITDCSDELLQALGKETVQGNSIADLTIFALPWLRLSPEHWPLQLPPLEFPTESHGPITLSGALCPEEGGWLLVWVDLTDVARRHSTIERQLRLQKATAKHATQMRRQAVVTETVMADWLEAMALQLAIPWLEVLVKDSNGWSVLAQYHRFNESIASLVKGKFSPLNEQYCEHPLQRTLASGETIWAVPYSAESTVEGWLCFGENSAKGLSTCLQEDDLMQLFAQIAAPALLNVRRAATKRLESRYEALQKISSGGWWEYDLSTRTFRISEGLARVLEVPFSETGLALDQWLQLLDPLDRDSFLVRVDAAVENNSFVHSLRLRVQNLSSWYRFEGLVLGEDNEKRMVGFAFNVSGLHKRLEEVDAVKARLAGLVDSAPGVIYVQRYENGLFQFEFCSASLTGILGWEPEAWQDHPFVSYVHPDDRDIYLKKSEHLMQHGRASLQYRVRSSEGEYRWLQDEAKLLRDDRGVPVEAIGLFLDVTEVRESAEKVLRSEENYRALVDDSPAIICRYRPDLRVIFANPTLAAALSVSPDEVENLDLGDFMSPAQRDSVKFNLSELTPAKPTVSSEICIHRPDTEKRWWVLYERGLFDAKGKLIQVQAVGRDNTEVHKTREQLFQSAKMATLGEMSTGLAHEINQPLTVIQMALVNLMTRVRNDQAPSDYVLEKLERVSSQVLRAAGIVKHVCVFGRWSGVDGVPLSPAKCVEGALSLVGQKLALMDIEVDSEDLENEPIVSGQPDRLEQVLVNLLINASYALCERQKLDPELKLRIKIRTVTGPDMMTLSVEDNGGGIPPNVLEKIFDAFFTTKPLDDGTGLGLSVSREIINQMSGQLSVENTEEGALFRIELPVLRLS